MFRGSGKERLLTVEMQTAAQPVQTPVRGASQPCDNAGSMRNRMEEYQERFGTVEELKKMVVGNAHKGLVKVYKELRVAVRPKPTQSYLLRCPHSVKNCKIQFHGFIGIRRHRIHGLRCPKGQKKGIWLGSC